MQNTESARSFCTQCGKPIGAGDKFCSACGSPVKGTPVVSAEPVMPAAATPATPAVPAATGETVLGAVLVSRKKNMFSVEGFHLIATPKRLIFAAFTNQMAGQAAKEEYKGGFLSGLIGAATVGYTYYQKYLTMDPEAALRENPQNFAFPLNTVSKVKFQMGSRHRDPDNNRDIWDESKLEFETPAGKQSFKIPHQLHDQARAVLSKVGLT